MKRVVAIVLLLLQTSPAAALDLDSLFYRPLDPDAWAESGPRLMLGRFIDAYSRRDLDAYAALLTEDFVFHFGDEEERALHPNGWGRDDEIASAEHLFHGTATRPAATSITLDPGEILVLPDPDHPCDRARHALIDLPRVTLLITLSNGEQLRVTGHHAYWIVREGEDWKVRRWDEEPAPEVFAPRECAPVAAASETTNRLWTVAPNPSRVGSQAMLTFAVERDGDGVDVAIYNVAGRRVALLARGPSEAGARSIAWDGRDEQGFPAPSGVYFLKARVGGRDWRERIIRM